MLRRHFFLIVLLTALLPAGAARAGEVVGTWATEGEKSHVVIAACDDRLCGNIVWLKEPLDDKGKPKHDINNPDAALQGRPIIGLPLLADFVAGEEPDIWEDGTIYNPEDGETYACTLTLLDANTLKVRGYVGLPLFGKTQIWTRIN